LSDFTKAGISYTLTPTNQRSETLLDAKHKIFLATLSIIRNEGMRAVRHRAVAKEAGVSLGATTYHFKTLDDLIASTFVYWLEQDNSNRKAALSSISDSVEAFKQGQPEQLFEQLYQASCDYLKTQIKNNRDDRFIELAFHNEALRNQQLSELLLEAWQNDVGQLSKFYEAIGSSDPKHDAEDTFALILHLERKSLLYPENKLESEFNIMTGTLKRHLQKVFELTA
jgi:DNA-binding transcriptional regulator YbjK